MMRISFERVAAAARGNSYLWLVAAVVLAAALAIGNGQDSAGAQETTEPVLADSAVPGEVLVKFEPGTSAATRTGVHAQSSGGQVQNVIPGIDVQVVAVEPGQEQAAVDAYEQDPNVVFAEVNGSYMAANYGKPNDPQVDQQWQFDNRAQTGGKKDADIYAFGAWQENSGSDAVTIAVLDSGIYQSHPDLQGKVSLEANFSASDIADDVYDHGTHVAGSAAASTNDGFGIAGTCGGCSLYNVRVLDDAGVGNSAGVADGIVWAVDNGAKVINMSFTGPSPSPTVKEAVDYAWGQGTVLVAAAGNKNSGNPAYPASLNNVVAVASTDHNDKRSNFSNFGEWVDVAAPGSSILSTSADGGHATMDGTSMASPHAAGVAGLIWSASPTGATNQDVVDKLEATANRVVGTGIYWSQGRINACRAVGATCDRDKTPPTVTGKTPSGGATGIALDQTIAATFSEPLDQASVSGSTVTLVKEGTTSTIPATVSYDTAFMRVILDPSTNLASNIPYTVRVKGGTGGVKDEYGSALAADEVWRFVTADTEAPGPPSIDLDATSDTGSSNTDNTTNDATPTLSGMAEAGSTVKVYEGTDLRGTATASGTGRWNLSAEMLVDGVHSFTARATDASGNTSAASGALAIAVDTAAPETNISSAPYGTTRSRTAYLYFSSSELGSVLGCRLDGAAFSACSSPKYYASLTDGSHAFEARATDKAGNTDPTPAARTWTVDATAPTVTSTTPPNGATDVGRQTEVKATFSEAMNPTSLSGTTFKLEKKNNSGDWDKVGGTVSYNAASRTATLSPANDLGVERNHRVTITTGAKDAAGNALAADRVWTFKTR